jgi:hypothetical protein
MNGVRLILHTFTLAAIIGVILWGCWVASHYHRHSNYKGTK